MSDIPGSPGAENHKATNLTEVTSSLQKPWSYEETVHRIEAIVARIESGELDLAEVFEEFETAVGHLRQCERFLAEHRQRADLLIETLTDEPDF